MMDFYPQFRTMHIIAVIGSGSLFFLRGVAIQHGGRWALAAEIRYLSYAIDILLLISALLLVTMLPSTVFANGWLAAKVTLLVIYIGLGSYALKRGRTQQVRLSCFVAALAVFAGMLVIARTHDPLGPLRILLG
jgi:uncharacterized membrane protein SirB2